MTKFGTLTPNGLIDEMGIDLDEVELNDLIAYSYGFLQGKSGKEMAKDDDLAEEYIRGYNDGVKAR